MNYKNKNFRSLKQKILFWFIGIVSLVLFLFSFSLYYFLDKSINLRIQTNLYHDAVFVHDALLNTKKLKNHINNKYFDNFEVAIIKGNKLIKQTKVFSLNNYKSYIDKNEIFFLNKVDEYTKNGIYILKFKNPFDGVIIIYKKGLSNKTEDLQDILLVLNPILLILLTIIGNILIDKILVPIQNITKTIKNISISNFSNTLELPKSNDEIRELSEAFNKMIYRIQDGVKAMDRFNSDISHELKTPLTVIKGELELNLRKQREPEYYIKSISTALEEIDKIEKLIEELLLTTKHTKQNIKDTYTICYLDTILINLCDKYEIDLKKKNIKLCIEKMDSIKLDTNESLITSIFSNLLDNAIKYTLNNKKITISLFQNEKVHFIVKDEGIGIPQNKISKITDRFYRVDESRNKEIKGFGLGLSIVKNSIDLYNGKLKIDSKEGVGTIIEVIL